MTQEDEEALAAAILGAIVGAEIGGVGGAAAGSIIFYALAKQRQRRW